MPIYSWLKSLTKSNAHRRRRFALNRRRNELFRPLAGEILEDRCLLSVATWDGGGSDNNWTTAGNWEGDVAPSLGNDLVFPASVPQTTNVNNFAAGMAFGSVLFGGSNYNVTGSQVVLAGGVTAQGTNNTFGLNMQLSAAAAFGQTQSGTLTIAGTIDLNSRNLVWSNDYLKFFMIDFERTRPGYYGADQLRLSFSLVCELASEAYRRENFGRAAGLDVVEDRRRVARGVARPRCAASPRGAPPMATRSQRQRLVPARRASPGWRSMDG